MEQMRKAAFFCLSKFSEGCSFYASMNHLLSPFELTFDYIRADYRRHLFYIVWSFRQQRNVLITVQNTIWITSHLFRVD